MTAGVFQLIKTTVAQVLLAKESQGETPAWSYLGCGVLCLIEENAIHTHFLRLYCVKVSGMAQLVRDAPPAPLTRFLSDVTCWLH